MSTNQRKNDMEIIKVKEKNSVVFDDRNNTVEWLKNG